MWPQNTLTERLNLKWPILQAPMGEHSTPELAAEVSNAGGMGGLGMWGLSSEEAALRVTDFRRKSSGSLNVNYPLWADPGDLSNVGTEIRASIQALYDIKGMGKLSTPKVEESTIDIMHLDMLLNEKPQVISFHFGLPSEEVIQALKDAGLYILCSATTVAESKVLESRGVDCIIAQGTEAGSHQGSFLGANVRKNPSLFSLLPQVVDAVSVPVIAAGGIADGRGIAAALMLGASGVQLGTAFLRCPEANVSPAHQAALSCAKDNSTLITKVVSGHPARVISNRLVKELENSEAEPLPFPAQWDLTLPLEEDDDPEFLGLLAGQSVAMTREMSAANLVQTLADETSHRLNYWGGVCN
jgi:nitronate monooxygenase